MASRPVWKGFLKLSLVSVPVKAYTAHKSDSGTIHLNQLHDECHSRIRYQKTCPIHGEVTNDEIISGYPIGNDQYVTVAPDELKAIRRQSDRAIEIDTFIAEDELDDRFLTDRSYYLVPDGAIAQKPYALIRTTLEQEHLRAVAEVILSNREQLVVVRPLGKLLLMTVVQHAAEQKAPDEFEEEVSEPNLIDQELRLTAQLVEGMTKSEWHFEDYQDQYRERLSELIESKIAGKQLVQKPEEEAPTVINLMDVLKASIEQIPVPEKSPAKTASGKSQRTRSTAGTKSSKASKSKAKPERIEAPSAPRTASKGKRSRKTG